MKRTLIVVLLIALGASNAVAKNPPPFVWWEGEDAVETNFPDRSPFSASTFAAKRHLLSGGDWLSNGGPRRGPEAFARWDVRVPRDGRWTLWTRKFWKHGPFRWRFDGGAWRTCGRDVALADSVTIRTHLGANWVCLGEVDLRRGARRFEIRLLAGPGEQLTACFDCFILTQAAFLPRGRWKPGETSGATEPGWWAFEPDRDPDGEVVLDLRGLNETEAGVNGRIRRKGAALTLGSGQPVRLWGVNCGPDVVRQDRASVRQLARKLARRGVNLVRYHGPVFDRGGKDPATVDRAFLAKLHVFVAELKAQGIYCELSVYFPLWFGMRPEWGFAGYARDQKPFALLFFDERMQAIHRGWLKTLLTTANPETGLPLGRDPAVAIVEIVNEDSPLFWTFKPGETIPWPHVETMERAFAAWLRKRHGSLEKAKHAWNGVSHPRDTADRCGLWPAWNLTAKGCGEGGRRKRASDQLRFLVEHVRHYYEETIAFLRSECGYDGLVVASNWKTADPRTLDALERWTYTAGDVIDRHGYFGGRHRGEGASYSVRTGHEYADRAAVRSPEALPIQVGQVAGYPHMISEIGWPNPNRFRADFPVIAAAYGALQGIDALCLFACSGPGWARSEEKFPYDVPTVLGQSPACALIYRRGDVAEVEPVIHEHLDPEDLFDFRGSLFAVPPALDELRKSHSRFGAKALSSPAVDPLAFFVGPVVTTIGRPGSGTRLDAWKGKPVDGDRRVVTSRGGALRWDREAGLVTIDTRRAQGATGYLRATGPIALGDVEIASGNEYGTVLIVSLDGEPLRRSQRILLQAMTEERLRGRRVENGRIVDLGEPPMMVRDVDARVTLRTTVRRWTVRDLDPTGVERRSRRVAVRSGRIEVRLPRDGIHVVLTGD